MSQPKGECVGITPWLPWPLSAWLWWTEPVRAERLALLRIGLALCLIADLLSNYTFETLAYYGKGGLGDPANFEWRFRSTHMTWSLLRGVGDPANFYLSFTIWSAATFWILGNSFAWLVFLRQNPPRQDRTGAALWFWSAAYLWYVAGLWSHMVAAGKIDAFAWIMPLIGFSIACLFQALDIAARLRDETYRIPWLALVAAFVLSFALTCAGFALTQIDTVDPSTWWRCLLQPWQENETMLMAAMFVWLASAVMLLVGFSTRLAAVMTWLLSMSFANANPYLDNAGDTIRSILLFYLMLCPCGAAWSIDALFQRRDQGGSVFVHPWPIRLLFVQMIFIYFMNGVYKLMGADWLNGDSLHYVLGDVVLTRFSPFMVQIDDGLARWMTWSVLAWEVSFPVLVLWKWSRRAALIMGVMFHLGIFATLELGGFVPYALCMYFPLLPWERLAPRSPPAQP